MFHGINIPCLLYPFICRWTFKLPSGLGCCKWHCNEHWSPCVLLNHGFFLDIRPGVGLQDHMVALFLVFSGMSILFPIVAVPIYIPPNSVGRFLSLHTLSNGLLFCRDSGTVHSDWCEVIPHCSFDLHFSNNE